MRTSSRPVAPVALTTAVGVHATALGPLVLAATDDALVLCAFDPPEAAAERARRAGLHPVEEAEGTAAQRRVLDEARTQLDAYLSGGRRDFTVPADLRLATPFSRRTVSILEEFVPYGRTTTYARLAEASTGRGPPGRSGRRWGPTRCAWSSRATGSSAPPAASVGTRAAWRPSDSSSTSKRRPARRCDRWTPTGISALLRAVGVRPRPRLPIRRVEHMSTLEISRLSGSCRTGPPSAASPADDIRRPVGSGLPSSGASASARPPPNGARRGRLPSPRRRSVGDAHGSSDSVTGSGEEGRGFPVGEGVGRGQVVRPGRGRQEFRPLVAVRRTGGPAEAGSGSAVLRRCQAFAPLVHQ